MTEPGIFPDEIEPTIGWRTWHLMKDGLLVSAYGTEWHAHEGMTAHCPMLDPGMGGPVPPGYFIPRFGYPAPAHLTGVAHEKCTCGFYAKKNPGQLSEPTCDYATPGKVVGTVRLWGKVVEHDNGYRAEHAYPDRLYLLDYPGWASEPEWHRHGRARLVASIYGVECSLISLDEWHLLCAAEGSPVETPTEAADAPGEQTGMTATSFGFGIRLDGEDHEKPLRSWLLRHSVAVNLSCAALNLAFAALNLWRLS